MVADRKADPVRKSEQTYGPNVELPVGSPEERQAAWKRLVDFWRNPPQPGKGAAPAGQYGTREDWHDDRNL